MGRTAWLLGGGTALGAVQVAVLEQLRARDGLPDAIYGVSVGALNALLAARDDLPALRTEWSAVRGTKTFQRPQIDIWNGLFSMRPLRKLLAPYAHPQALRTECYAGLVDLGRGVYQNVALHELPTGADVVDAVVGSATQPGIHETARLHGRLVADGGVRHVLPAVPDWETYETVHAVLCAPVDRQDTLPQKRVNSAIEAAERTLELLLERVAADNVQRLRAWAAGGVAVWLYAPKDGGALGRPFDASPETIARRLDTIGPAMWESRQQLGRNP